MTKTAIEEKKEQLEIQKAKLLSKEQKIKELERKKQLQKLISLGQLVAENGLDSFDRDTLLGALLEVKEKSGHADNLESWRERAKLALEKNIPNEVPVIVTFLTPPNKDVRAILKNSGLKWNPFRQEWQGFSNPTSLREALNTTDAGIQEIAIG